MSNTPYIGRRVAVGIGKESTRGTVATAAYWEKQVNVKIDPTLKELHTGSAFGSIEDTQDSFGIQLTSKLDIDMNLKDKSLGLWLLSLFGKDTVATHAGETVVYDHTFSVEETNQHQSLTVTSHDPIQDYQYALGMIDSMQIDVEIGKLSTAKVTLMAKGGSTIPVTQTGTLNNTTSVTGLTDTTQIRLGSPVSGTGIPANTTVASIDSATSLTLSQAATTTGAQSLTFTDGIVSPSFISENYFLPQMGTYKDADTAAGLAGASAKKIKKLSLKIAKNLETDMVLGSINPNDYLNKQFVVTGSIESFFENESDFKTGYLADGYRAMLLDLKNTDVTIGTAANPELQIQMNRVKIETLARDLGNNNVVKQTVTFKADWDVTTSQMLSMILTNLVTSY